MRKLAVVIAFVTVVACHRSAPAPTAPPVDPDLARLPLAARLDREAKLRPTGTPRSEDVLSALARGGLSLARHRQVLASTVGASFCTSALTTKGVAIAVCEYPAEDVARRGLAYSHQAFDRLIPGRR